MEAITNSNICVQRKLFDKPFITAMNQPPSNHREIRTE